MTNNNTTVGVGLISVGWMGKVHSRAYQSIPVVYPELGITPRLVIAADTEPSRAEYARNVLGYAESTLDYHEVLAHPDVDVVSICAPNFLHAEIGIAAARAGKAFWIEKPVGRGVDETTAVEAAADEAGVVTSIGFNYRHAPAIEKAKALIADGSLGRITNIRGTFFADYSAEPNGALSWRFNRKLAGSGVLGDLMGHLADLVQYMLGPVSDVTGMTSTVHTHRPIQQMGTGTHFDVIEGGELGPVENEDYAGMLVRFGPDAVAAGAVGTLEASRVAVGPRASYNVEIYGTEGSLMWDFERMNELQVAIGRKGDLVGYQRVMAGPGFGDFSHFQPGAGTGMGFDDLKVVEARKFLESYVGARHLNSNIHDAVAAAKIVDAAERSAETGQWISITPTPGVTSAMR
ncbi:MAG: Gfo/Idh/MocA family protein [Microbacteriaceae bacterium]